MKTKIFNLLILDESGSMSSMAKQAVDSVNETLQTIRAAHKEFPDQEHFVSFVTFNSSGIKTILDQESAEKVEDITPAQFNPACCTPLYDAIGMSVNHLKQTVKDNDKVLVTIITDGYENASQEYNQVCIKCLTDLLGQQGWTFAYIGANQDAMAVSRSLGIKNSMNFTATGTGFTCMSEKLTTSRKNWFKKVSENQNDIDKDFFD